MIDSVIRKALEGRIAAHGLTWIKLRHFELRSTEKLIVLDVDLEGEAAPVRISARYRVDPAGVTVESVETSKKWLTEVAHLALAKHGGTIELPGGLVGSMARAVL
ncbi:MAG: hypothetical protein ACKV19_25305 [Verrucomicrobiales bacterium]